MQRRYDLNRTRGQGSTASATTGGGSPAPPLREGLVEEAYLFEQTLRDPEARARTRRFLELGGQTRDPELRVDDLVTELGGS